MKKKVILFYPIISPFYQEHRIPLSLLSLASPLLENGYEVEIIDSRIRGDFKQAVLQEIDHAICVGISMITGDQINYGLEMARLIKDKRPDAPIVVGGWHPTIEPRTTIEHPLIDIVVRGPGERTFAELVDHLDQSRPLDNILGITYKENGKIRENPARPLEDINVFPPTPYHLINVEKYLVISKLPREIMYFSSRGCPFRCTFCSIITVYKKRWFALYPKRVVDDIERLVKTYNVWRIHFFDDCFFIDLERVKQICRMVIDRKLSIKWSAQIRAGDIQRFDDELWTLVKGSGCVWLVMGLESGSQRMLDLIRKDEKVEDSIIAYEKIVLHRLNPGAAFIFGIPGERWEDVLATIKLVVKLKAIYPEATFSFFFYTPYPGTPLFEMALKYGLERPKSLQEWSRFTGTRINIPWVNDSYLDRLKKILRFYFPLAYPTSELREKLQNLNFIFRIASNVLRPLAYFRLKNNFFMFPIEWLVYKEFIKIWPQKDRFFIKKLPGEF
jgi:radical SAM superfamily enzyme YgiQ (UPF0313 family)